jgi:hypothetical protein
MARSFNILHRINSMYYTQEELDALDAGLDISAEDFDGPSDVVPISNPAIFSEAQRFAQIQAIMQRAEKMPQMYDQKAVEEMFLRTLKVPASEVSRHICIAPAGPLGSPSGSLAVLEVANVWVKSWHYEHILLSNGPAHARSSIKLLSSGISQCY